MVPGGRWHLTFALGLQENSMFWITQVQGIGVSSVFLKTQPCHCLQLICLCISYWLFRFDTITFQKHIPLHPRLVAFGFFDTFATSESTLRLTVTEFSH